MFKSYSRVRRFLFVSLFMAASSHSAEIINNLQTGYHGGFYMKTEDDRFKIKMGARLDFGYGYGFLDSTKDYGSFDLLHAKLYLGGNVFSPDIQFFLQAGAASNSRPAVFSNQSESTNGSFSLEDFYVRLSNESWNVKLGQFKVPFGRQWMTYSGNLQFADRSLATKYFLLGRDRGLTLSSDKETFSMTLGVFNGAGTLGQSTGLQPNVSNGSSSGLGHLYVARIVATPFGSTGYSEGDVEQSEGARFEWGASFAYDQDRSVDINGDAVIDDSKADALHGETDLSWKFFGASSSGEFFYRKIKSDVFGNTNSYGFYVQSGYMVVPGKYELAARFGWLDPNTSLTSDRILETSGVINSYLFSDHRYKVQTQYTWRKSELATGSSRDDHLVDLLLQLTI